MKPYATFRRHPLGRVGRTNEDRQPADVIPHGKFGVGESTGHPIGLVIVVWLLSLELVCVPRFFAAQVMLGGLVALFLRRQHQAGLFICVGLIVIALIGIPALRWFFGTTLLAGSVVGYFLWRRDQAESIVPATYVCVPPY